jgi:site-specific DNA recombinase
LGKYIPYYILMTRESLRKAVGYIRVSTEGQASKGVSLQAQSDRIEAWAVANLYDLVNIYKDAGLSGFRVENRPGLQAALAEAEASKAALVVYSLSRSARSTKDAIEISEKLDRAGADLVSLSEHIDTTSAAGKMVFRMLAVLAEFERDQIAEWTSTAMRFKKSQGKRVGSVPSGYDLANDGETLVPNPKEQRGLAIIYKLRRVGRSLREIAEVLDELGLRPKRGRVWSAAAIRRILLREAA